MIGSFISCVTPLLRIIWACQLCVPLAAMSVEDENQKVFQGTPSEDVRLENLGYEQGRSIEEVFFAWQVC